MDDGTMILWDINYVWGKDENMKNSGQKERPSDKKKYTFFSDPDVIVKRAETSAVVSDSLSF